MDHTCNRRSHQRHLSHTAAEMIEKRHRDLEHAVQGFGLHLVREPPPEIAEAVPLVVPTVQPHGEDSTGLEVLSERLNRGFAIGRVVQNTDAVNDIEALWRKGQCEHIGLESNKVTVGKVFGGNLRGSTQVDANHARSPASCYFGKPAHAASHVENELVLQFVTPQSGFHLKLALGVRHVVFAQRRLLIPMPLKTETGGVVLHLHETGDATHVWKGALAGRAGKASGLVTFKFGTATQASQDRLQVSGQG